MRNRKKYRFNKIKTGSITRRTSNYIQSNMKVRDGQLLSESKLLDRLGNSNLELAINCGVLTEQDDLDLDEPVGDEPGLGDEDLGDEDLGDEDLGDEGLGDEDELDFGDEDEELGLDVDEDLEEEIDELEEAYGEEAVRDAFESRYGGDLGEDELDLEGEEDLDLDLEGEDLDLEGEEDLEGGEDLDLEGEGLGDEDLGDLDDEGIVADDMMEEGLYEWLEREFIPNRLAEERRKTREK